jgi:hypothetical protein
VIYTYLDTHFSLYIYTGKGKHGAAKDMSKNDFLQMLKSSTSKTGTGTTASSSKTHPSKPDAAGWHREMEGGEGEGGPTEASWNAIKDDYLMSAPKLNDFEDSDDEGELEGEGIMSESEGED